MTFWMRIPIGDGGGGARAHSRDPCLRVRDRSGALTFSWLGVEVEVPHRAETYQVSVALNGNGADGNRYPRTVELTSAPKSIRKK